MSLNSCRRERFIATSLCVYDDRLPAGPSAANQATDPFRASQEPTGDGPQRRALRDEGAAKKQPSLARRCFAHRLMLLILPRLEQMDDARSAGLQKLSDQTAMATPPECLRTHEARAGCGNGRGECSLPPFSAHTGRVAAEGRNAKTPETIFARFAGETPAKFDCVPIRDPPALERGAEGGFIELGVVARPWKTSNIDKSSDVRGFEHGHELLERSRSVPDRPDGHARPVTPSTKRPQSHSGLERRAWPE